MIENTSKSPPPFIVPGSIEASESRGQAQLVASELLPSKMRSREIFERMGFRFGEVLKDDPIFIHATLPPGWKKRKTDHPKWSEIVDENDEIRVNVFYKAAFYDRNAHMILVGRFQIKSDRYDDDRIAEKSTAQVIDSKNQKVLFSVTKGPIKIDGYTYSASDAAEEAARSWCKDNLLVGNIDNVEAWFRD